MTTISRCLRVLLTADDEQSEPAQLSLGLRRQGIVRCQKEIQGQPAASTRWWSWSGGTAMVVPFPGSSRY